MASDLKPNLETTLELNLSIAHQFHQKWNAGLSLPTADFLSIYAPNITWYDHFFQLHLIGPSAVEQLRQRWLGAHDNASIEIESIQPTPTGAVLQLINKGRFARDMLPKRSASGKEFACHACYVLRINKEGLVERVDEYQPTYFDELYYTEGYVLRDGGAVKGA